MIFFQIGKFYFRSDVLFSQPAQVPYTQNGHTAVGSVPWVAPSSRSRQAADAAASWRSNKKNADKLTGDAVFHRARGYDSDLTTS